MSIQRLPINQIKPNDHNPRDITDDKFAKLVKSIQDFPQMLEVRPLVIDENNVVLGGNMRLKALKKAGITEVPVERVTDWTEDQKREFIIKDNIGYGEWDWDILANEWDVEKLDDWGLDMTTWEVSEEEDLKAEEDDYQMPDEIQTDIQLGDIFQIGEHRLMCGDSTDSDQVAKLMNGEKADLAHNDPPYGMKKEKEGVLNDNLNFDDLLKFNRQWIALQFSHLKENGSWYCWGIDEPLMDIYSNIIKPYIKEQKATFRNLITWDKGSGQGQLSDGFRMYPIADEKCLFVMCGVQDFDEHGKAQIYLMPYLKYMTENKNKTSMNEKEINKLLGYSSIASHWFLNKSEEQNQPRLISENDYKKLQTYCQQNNIDAFKKEYDELKKEYYSTRAYFNNTHDNQNNVWHFERERERDHGHATPKPIPLCERAIKSSCPKSGLVLDFFLGSGSTMVAAHQLNRKCYGMELDPKYCQVIIDRMRKLDPNIQITRNGEPYGV